MEFHPRRVGSPREQVLQDGFQQTVPTQTAETLDTSEATVTGLADSQEALCTGWNMSTINI